MQQLLLQNLKIKKNCNRKCCKKNKMKKFATTFDGADLQSVS